MRIAFTAGLTAVWRQMSGVDIYAKEYTSLSTKLIGYLMGFLDPNSVKTIAKRTKLIDKLINKLKLDTVVEIGSGYSSRSLRFKRNNFYELDMPNFEKKKKDSIFIPFDITKDNLKLNLNKAIFIIEGVTMYLKKREVIELLKQIRKYNGYLIIDFFNSEYSRKNKTIREELYKLILRGILKRKDLFSYRIKSISECYKLLSKLGYKDIEHYDYEVDHTLDVLFCAKI